MSEVNTLADRKLPPFIKQEEVYCACESGELRYCLAAKVGRDT